MNIRRIKISKAAFFIWSFMRLIRWGNLFILVVTQYATRLFLIGPKQSYREILLEPSLFFLSLCTVLIAAAGYIINDYYDIKIDMINKPKRVVLTTIISRRIGIIMHVLLNTVAILLAYLFLSLNVALFITFCGFILWVYSNYLKRIAFWGNLCIALLAFGVIFMIGLYYKDHMEWILIFGFFAFITTLIREIIKDMEDIKGDAEFDCKTLPILIGLFRTKIVVSIFLMAMLLFILGLRNYFNETLVVYLLLLVALPTIFVLIKLIYADKKKDFTLLSTSMKLIMIFGVLGMILI